MNHLAILSTGWHSYTDSSSPWQGQHTTGASLCLGMADRQRGANIGTSRDVLCACEGWCVCSWPCLDRYIHALQHILESLGKGEDGWETIFGLLCQSTQNYGIKGGRNTWIECAWWLWRCHEVLAHHLAWTTLEGWAACEELI